VSNLVSFNGKKLINLKTVETVQDTDYVVIQKDTNGDQTTVKISQALYADLLSESKREGWEAFFDTEYPTSSAPLAVDADTWTVIPNNAGFPLTTATNLPEGVTSFYDGTTQEFFMDVQEAQYFVTIGFAVIPSTANATLSVRGLLGGGGPFFGPSTYPLAVDAGEVNVINVSLQFPSTANLFDQGFQMSLNCSADCEVYGALYQVAKVVDKSNG